MTCPNCGAPLCLNPESDYLNCEYCRNLYRPPANDQGVRVLDEPSGIGCPACGGSLVHAAIEGQRCHFCQSCRGLLFPMDTFVPAIAHLRAHRETPAAVQPRPDPSELTRHLDCPRCGGSMDTHYYGGPGNIVIDDCCRCRLNWLDGGELTRIVRAPERWTAGIEEPPTQYNER
jgi:Zn-finger nucleic acid-binding protein